MAFFSRCLAPVSRVSGIKIDWMGAVLAASAVILISVGVNSINRFGVLLAKAEAFPHLGGLSPGPVMIVLGLVLQYLN